MTLQQMLNASSVDLGYAQPTADQTTRITRWLNEGYRHLMSAPGREQLRDYTITLTTESNRAMYPLPQAVAKVYAGFQVTNSVRLGMMTMSAYRTVNAGLNQNGNFANWWIPYGWSPVLRQPEGTGLWAVSDNAADTTQKFNVQGFSVNGDMTPEVQSSVLTGTTRVQIGTATDWNILERLDLTAVGVGVIRVYDAAVAGNEIIRLQPGQTSAQYQHIILFETPSSAVDYRFDVCLQLTELSQPNDIPLLPADFHDMLPLYVRLRDEKRSGADPRLVWDNAEMKDRVVSLARYVEWPKDYTPVVAGSTSGYGWNDLGPNYPADYVWR